MTTIAGTGESGYNDDGQLAVNALLNCPCGLFVTDDEEVLFCDSGNYLVRKIDRNGVITTIAGNATRGFDGDGQLATSASLNYPTSVFQYKHEIYIADFGNNRLRKIDRNGIMTTIAGNGADGYNGDGMLATQASICPHCVYVHNDQIYISDVFNHRIRKILPNGIITTIAGTGEQGYNGDGQLAIHAHFFKPSGLFVDTDSQIYITDSDNHCIRKIDQFGIISTIAGSGKQGYSGDFPFDFEQYPHIGPRKKPLIKPFPNAYHDIVIYYNDYNNSTATWTKYETLSKKTTFN